MTSHELAHKLLAGPDLPVATSVGCDDESICGVDQLTVNPGTYTKDRIYVCSNGKWQDSQNPEPTHIFVSSRADYEFQVETFEDETFEDDED